MPYERKRILLVDDVKTIRKLAQAMLGTEFDYAEAENGQQANQMALSWQPDLIVMDLHMPVMDGIDGLDHLKREPETRKIPVIILTSEVEEQKRLRCLELGCAEFLRKPLDRAVLKTAVGRNLPSG